MWISEVGMSYEAMRQDLDPVIFLSIRSVKSISERGKIDEEAFVTDI